MKNFDKQIDEIVKSLKLTQKGSDLVTASLYHNLKYRIGLRLASELSDEEMSKIVKLLETKDDQKLFTELDKVVPNFDNLISEELEKFKVDFSKSQ